MSGKIFAEKHAMPHIFVRFHAIFLCCVIAVAVCVLSSPSAAQIPLLQTSNPMSATSGFPPTNVQLASPNWWERGTGIDGCLERAPTFAWALSANPFETARSGRVFGGVDLLTGDYMPSETDLALPAPGFSWVIGRTYRFRGETGTDGYEDPGGYQGRNWFQASQPEIQMLTSGTTVRIVYGGDRFVEFGDPVETSDPEIEVKKVWRGINGAAGLVLLSEDVSTPGHPVEVLTYIDQHGARTTFFGQNLQGSDASKRGQLWKLEDAGGNVAFVGNETNALDALAGYDSSGRILIAYDGRGNDLGRRKYVYSYSPQPIGGAQRLESVTAFTRVATTGVDPWKEIARVVYSYWPEEGLAGVQTPFARPGDLIGVVVRTATSEIVAQGQEPVWAVSRKHYRYAYAAQGDVGNNGRLSLVVGFEGSRRFNFDGAVTTAAKSAWEAMPAPGAEIPNAMRIATDDALKPYSDVGLTYTALGRVATAFFSGQCDCSGASGVHTFTYESRPVEPPAAEALTSAWHRCIIKTPSIDDRTAGPNAEHAFQIHYLNQLGQPLSSVTIQRAESQLWSKNYTQPTGSDARKWWARGITRDSAGRVVSEHSCDNVVSYQHLDPPDGTPLWGNFVFDPTQGLVTRYERLPASAPTPLPGETEVPTSAVAEGFVYAVRYSKGADPQVKTFVAASLDYEVDALKLIVNLGTTSVTLNRPVIRISRTHRGPADGSVWSPLWILNADNIDGVTMSDYVGHGAEASWTATLVPVRTTLAAPAVSTANNGSGASVKSHSHFDAAGRLVLTQSVDGRITRRFYDGATGQVSLVEYDIAMSGELHGGHVFTSSASENDEALAIETAYAYDAIGRLRAVTTPSSTLGNQTSFTSYGRTSDHRLTTISVPLAIPPEDPDQPTTPPQATKTVFDAGAKFYGPGSLTIENHAGRVEFSGTIGVLEEGNLSWHEFDSATSLPTVKIKTAAHLTVSPDAWIDSNALPPQEDRNLQGFNVLRTTPSNAAVSLQLRSTNVKLFNPTGHRLDEARSYFHQARAVSSTEADRGPHRAYDVSKFVYDGSGRIKTSESETSDITTFDHDVLGRIVEIRRGMRVPGGIVGVSLPGTTTADPVEERCFTVARFQYDMPQLGPVGMASPSQVEQVSQTKSNDLETIRVSTTLRDFRGIPFASVGPHLLTEHPITGLDYQGRPQALAMVVPSGSPTANRETFITSLAGGIEQEFNGGISALQQRNLSPESISRFEYDELGRQFRTRHSNLYTSGGSAILERADRPVIEQQWFNPVGKVAMVSGSSVEQYRYDRACRLEHRIVFASTPADQSYDVRVAGPATGSVIVRQEAFVYDQKSGALEATFTIDAWPRGSTSSSNCTTDSDFPMSPIADPRSLFSGSATSDRDLTWPNSSEGGLLGFPRATVYERDHLDRVVRSVDAKMPEFTPGVVARPTAANPVAITLQARDEATIFKNPSLTHTTGEELQNFKWYDEFGRPVAEFGPRLTGQVIDYDLDGSEGDYESLLMIAPPTGPCSVIPQYMKKKIRTDAGRVVRSEISYVPSAGMLTESEIHAQEFMDRVLRDPAVQNADQDFYRYALVPEGFFADGSPVFGNQPFSMWEPHNDEEATRAIPPGGTIPAILQKVDSQGRPFYVVDEDGAVREQKLDKSPDRLLRESLRMFPPELPDHHRDPLNEPVKMEFEFLPGGKVVLKHGTPSVGGNLPFNVGGITIDPGFGFEGSGSTKLRLTPGDAAPANGDPWFPPDFEALRHKNQLWPRPVPANGTEPLMPIQVRRRDTVLPGGLSDAALPSGLQTPGLFNVAGASAVLNPSPSALHVLPMPGDMRATPGPQCFQTPMAVPPSDITLPNSGYENSIDTAIGRIGMLSIYPTDSTLDPNVSDVPPEVLVPRGSTPITRYGGWLGIQMPPWTELSGPNIVSPSFDPYELRPVPSLSDGRPDGWPSRPGDVPTTNLAYKPGELSLDRYYRPIHREWWTRRDAEVSPLTPSGAPSPLFHEEWARDPFTGSPKIISLASYPQETMVRRPGCPEPKEETIYWLCGSVGSASAAASTGSVLTDSEEPLWASTELEFASSLQGPPPTFVTRETERFNISDRGNWSNYARYRGREFGNNLPPEGSGGSRVLEFGGPRTGSGIGPKGQAWYSTEQLDAGAAPGDNTVIQRGGDNRMFEAQGFRGDPPPNEPDTGFTIKPKYSHGGLLLNDGERFSYRYDALKRLVQVDRDLSLPHWGIPVAQRPAPDADPAVRLKPFARYTYDALGRRSSAMYDDNGDGFFEDESVEFFIHDEQWRVVATYRQAAAPAYEFDDSVTPPHGPTNPNNALSKSRPAPLLYERYVYHARGLDGVSDVYGPDQPVLRQRFRYYRTDKLQIPVLVNGQPNGQTSEVDVEVECFEPGTTTTINNVPPTAYTRIKQETLYYIQSLRGDVVSLISEETPLGAGSATGDLPPNAAGPSSNGARIIETVRYTSFGVPRVYKRYACDIADDQIRPLIRGVTQDPSVPNGGVGEADYTLFFNGFFDGAWYCDIADDSGRPLQDGRPVGSVAGVENNGVTEGDYNLFFAEFFNGGVNEDLGDEWGVLSHPDTNNRIGYAGYWWDERVNMYVVRNRWYTPRTGRWLTPDPIGYAGGRNLYEYVESRPWEFTDPDGLQPRMSQADAVRARLEFERYGGNPPPPPGEAARAIVRGVGRSLSNTVTGTIRVLADPFGEMGGPGIVGGLMVGSTQVGIRGHSFVTGEAFDSWGNSTGQTITTEQRAEYFTDAATFVVGVFAPKLARGSAVERVGGIPDAPAAPKPKAVAETVVTETAARAPDTAAPPATTQGTQASPSPVPCSDCPGGPIQQRYADITVDGQLVKGYGPDSPYDRVRDYGRTPTDADRALGRTDHQPPLAQRWYEGDPAVNELPGFLQTAAERAASAADQSRMFPRTVPDHVQGAEVKNYSMQFRKKYFGY